MNNQIVKENTLEYWVLKLRKLLDEDSEYSIHRSDGENMDLGDCFQIETVLGKIDEFLPEYESEGVK